MNKISEFIVKCAWCGKFLRVCKFKDEDVKRFSVSHGICPECSKKLLAEERRP